MKLSSNNHSVAYLKRLAKKLGRDQNIPHLQALDLTAKTAGFNNWKHFLNTQEKDIKDSSFISNTISKESIDWEHRDPYRNLLVCAVNSLIHKNYISLNLDDINEENEKGHIFTEMFGYKSVIIWRNIGFGELLISVWWKYNNNNHPQANLEGNQKENFNLSQPLANRDKYRKFVGVTASCWLERKNGKYIQGKGRRSIIAIYTRKGELKNLKELPLIKSNGYKAYGPFRC